MSDHAPALHISDVTSAEGIGRSTLIETAWPRGFASKVDQDGGCLRKAELSGIEIQRVLLSLASRPTLCACPEGKPAPNRGTGSQSGMGWSGIDSPLARSVNDLVSGAAQILFGNTTGAQT
jgi:hypothetical protein